MEERPLPATDCTKYLKSTRYIPRTRDASFHPTRPPPSPTNPWLQVPPSPFLKSTSCPHLQACGSLPLPLVHRPRGCSALVYAFVPTAYVRGIFPPNELPSEQSPNLGKMRGGGGVEDGEGGGHLSPSLCRISGFLRNFFAFRNIAILQLLSDMKKHETSTVQIS